jgi:hypothetical protein
MTDPASRQRRGRRIAMTPDELDAFLTAQHTCRVATTSPSGPHVTALWFVWHDAAVWLYSLSDSQRWSDLTRDPRAAVVVDAGEAYDELRGAELRGQAAIVGEVPRTGQPDPALDVVEGLFVAKYVGAGAMAYDGRHAWLRLTPDYIRSWDFRKLATLQ